MINLVESRGDSCITHLIGMKGIEIFIPESAFIRVTT